VCLQAPVLSVLPALMAAWTAVSTHLQLIVQLYRSKRSAPTRPIRNPTLRSHRPATQSLRSLCRTLASRV